MSALKVFILLSISTVLVIALPTQSSLTQERSSSDFEDDPIGYLSEQAGEFLDDILGEDNVHVNY